MKNFYNLEDFGLQLVPIEVKICFCLKLIKIKEVYKDLVTIIIPRHINKTNEILELANRLNLSTQLLNKNDIISNNKEVVIVNALGSYPIILIMPKVFSSVNLLLKN